MQSGEEPKKKFDFEERFGHNIMGIIASILIFVGMILFMSVVYQSLTDWLKVICMFGISSFVFVAGLLSYRKRENTFALALMLCGMGAYYITILIMYFQFHLIKAIPMYLCIAIWMIGITFLARIVKNQATIIIGQIGITFAIVIGAFNMQSINDAYFLLSYFIISSVYFYFMFREEDNFFVKITLYILESLTFLVFVAR